MGTGAISRSIGQPLALGTLHHYRRSLFVGYATCDAVVVAEVKLRQIPVQVLLLAVLVHTIHAALEQTEVALTVVGVPFVADIFVLAVVHGIVLREVLVETTVIAGLVGADLAFA